MLNVVLSGIAWDSLVAVLVTVLLLWLPGLALASILGLRGWFLAGTAPAVTMGLVGVGAPLFAMTGLFWSPLKFAAWCIAVTGLAAVGVFVARKRGLALVVPMNRWSGKGSLAVAAALVAAVGVAVLVVSGATKGLGNVPLGWDAPFHGNAIRLIAETGNTSTRFLGWIDFPDDVGKTFYPNAYHCFEALVYSVSGSDIPRVINTGMLVTTTLAVPLGTIALVRAAGGAAGFAAASALVSTSFTYYPWDIYQWGQLFPYAAALVLLLPFFAVFLRWLDTRMDRLAILVAVIATGLTGTHTASVFVAAIFAVFLVVQRLVHDPKAWIRTELPRLALVGAGTAVLASTYLLGATSMAGTIAAYDWPAVATFPDALENVLTFGGYTWLLLSVTTLVGMVLLWRDGRFRWMVVGYLTFAGLYVSAMASDHPLVQTLTTPWWNDRFRLAAVIILPATLASGWALQAVARVVSDRVMTRVPATAFGRRTAAIVLAAAGVTLTLVYFAQSVGGYAGPNASRMTWVYSSSVLTSLEYRGLDEMGRIVRPGEVVMNDRGDGTVWSFALSGRRPVIGHYQGGMVAPHRELLLEKFNQLSTDRAVAEAIRNLNVRYVMIGEGHIAEFQRSNGLVGLDRLDGLTPAYRNAEFQLYRVEWTKLAG